MEIAQMHFPVKWENVGNFQEVFLKGKRFGKLFFYGPHLVVNKEKRLLRNFQGNEFMHYSEELFYGPTGKTKFIFDKKIEDCYMVLAYGWEIGEVFKGWSRDGGNGWTHDRQVTPRTWKTRKAATEDLFDQWRKKRMFDADLRSIRKEKVGTSN